MRAGKTAETPRREARPMLAKSEQFLASAQRAEEEGESDASLLAAIHAAITANDAICVALVGMRSADPDHQRAADLLESAAAGQEDLAQRAKQLRALLKKKNLVEYESRRATAAEARDALERAERFVRWASEVLVRARL